MRLGLAGLSLFSHALTQTHKHPCRCLAMAQQLSRSADAFPLTRLPFDKLVLLSLAGAGAFQPGSKIVGYADMTALNKSNGKVATFAIRVDGTGTAATSTSV